MFFCSDASVSCLGVVVSPAFGAFLRALCELGGKKSYDKDPRTYGDISSGKKKRDPDSDPFHAAALFVKRIRKKVEDVELHVLGVVFDDQLFVDLFRDLVAFGNRYQLTGELFAVGLDVRRNHGDRAVVQGLLDLRVLRHFFFEADDLVDANFIRRNVDLLAVDEDVAVIHQLACSPNGAGEAEAVNHVVQTALQQLKQYVTGNALAVEGAFDVAAHLFLENVVAEAKLLLLFQTLTKLGLFAATRFGTMLTRRVRTTLLDAVILR